MRISTTRRSLLKMMGAGAVLSAAGCCCRSFPTPTILDLPPPAATIHPILKPVGVSTRPRPGTAYCLDVHTHFFNATDINIKGYFEGGVVRDHVPASLQDFVRSLGGIVDAMAADAPAAKTEYELLLQYAGNSRPLADPDHPLQGEIANRRSDIADDLLKKMQSQGLDEHFNKLRRDQMQKLGITAQENGKLDRATVLEALSHKTRMAAHKARYGHVNQAAHGGDPGGNLEFVGHILNYRFAAMRSFQANYCEDPDRFPIDGVFAAMVDFDHFLDCPPISDREDQVRLHSLLAQMSGGWMLPLVPYNPWSDVIAPGSSLALVKKAITDYGFVGVKIYPATGFFPYGNATLPPLPTHLVPGKPSGAALDAALYAMFEWCADNEVPVMAHAEETMGYDVPADKFAEFEGWNALLDAFQARRPNLKPPAINLGHFGGDSAADSDGSEWTALMAGLFSHPMGKKVYGDLGYWTALCDCDSWSQDGAAALARLNKALAVPQAPDRIMYGTDWYMISTVQEWGDYAKDVSTHVKAGAARLPMDKFFWKNAMTCYGLGVGGGQRQRVIDFYGKIPGGVPPWLT